MLKAHGSWMLLGSADEQKSAAEGTVEAWGAVGLGPRAVVRSEEGLLGRFAMYVPPVLEVMGRAKVERQPSNNCTRAI